MVTICQNYSLSAASIDAVSEKIESVCSEFQMDSRTVMRYRLSIEECLLSWLDLFGEGPRVDFEVGKRMGRRFIRVSVEGTQYNPYEQQSEDFGQGGRELLMNIGLIPGYSYLGGKNQLTFTIEKKTGNQILSLFGVIFAGVLVGLLGKLLPAELLARLTDNLITPIEDTFFNILSCIAGPMIFLSVAWGVYGIGDIYTLGRVGKKLMLNFFGVVFLFGALGLLAYPALGPALTSASTQTSQFGKILQMILNIFPSDVFSPFINNNTLQIIFIAFIIGLSMIFLGQRTSSIARAIEQINNIITFLMTFVSKLVPYFVFIVIVQMIWSDTLREFSSVWYFSLIFMGAYLAIHILFTVYVAIRHGDSPFRLFKKCLPSYLIAVTTASSSATFESNMRISQEKMGVSNAFSSFGIPFGMVLFKPSTALYYLLFCFYLSNVYGGSVQVSLSWIIVALLITAVSAIATPPIPGGAAATYTILFSQLGIPAGALAIAIAVDMIFDFILTSGDMYALLLEIYHVSFKVGMRQPEKK